MTFLIAVVAGVAGGAAFWALTRYGERVKTRFGRTQFRRGRTPKSTGPPAMDAWRVALERDLDGRHGDVSPGTGGSPEPVEERTKRRVSEHPVPEHPVPEVPVPQRSELQPPLELAQHQRREPQAEVPLINELPDLSHRLTASPSQALGSFEEPPTIIWPQAGGPPDRRPRPEAHPVRVITVDRPGMNPQAIPDPTFPFAIGAHRDSSLRVPGEPDAVVIREHLGQPVAIGFDGTSTLGGHLLSRSPMPITSSNAILQIGEVVVNLSGIVTPAKAGTLDFESTTRSGIDLVSRTGLGFASFAWSMGHSNAAPELAAATADALVPVLWGPEAAVAAAMGATETSDALTTNIVAAVEVLDGDRRDFSIAGVGEARIFIKEDNGNGQSRYIEVNPERLDAGIAGGLWRCHIDRTYPGVVVVGVDREHLGVGDFDHLTRVADIVATLQGTPYPSR